ncbi:MAG TPA: tryptophan 2,3-dioxygenase family protein, partial [Gaiellaceae bacterium]|nr:tryptophan 2,3-dioxygenase family protein [Gaiellaceae bacterium]
MSDEYAPILAGPGQSDYERYLRTDELLSLQKTADEWVHRDELLFQTVHQSSELWLKHAWMEVEEATRLIEARELSAAIRLLRRACAALKYVEGFLDHLEQMSPWEYQEVRRVLGHGSGFDSPGFREIRRVSPPLLGAFDALRRERGLSLLEVYTRARENEDLYQLAERLTEWDERVGVWRCRHFKVVARIIGE